MAELDPEQLRKLAEQLLAYDWTEAWRRPELPKQAGDAILTLLDRLTRTRAALDELVACKDLKERISAYKGRHYWNTDDCPAAQTDPSDPYTAHCADIDEYKRRKPLAWAAARKALEVLGVATQAPERDASNTKGVA